MSKSPFMAKILKLAILFAAAGRNIGRISEIVRTVLHKLIVVRLASKRFRAYGDTLGYGETLGNSEAFAYLHWRVRQALDRIRGTVPALGFTATMEH